MKTRYLTMRGVARMAVRLHIDLLSAVGLMAAIGEPESDGRLDYLNNLGIERMSPFQTERAFVPIDERYNAQQLLIDTTNLHRTEREVPGDMALDHIYQHVRELASALAEVKFVRHSAQASQWRQPMREILRGGTR